MSSDCATPGRDSLEAQIKDARSRAELFSSSLREAREQEAKALNDLEMERRKWTHSFEEKSFMIEQLERELSSTVEALDYEQHGDFKDTTHIRNTDAYSKILNSSEIASRNHDLFHASSSYGFSSDQEALHAKESDFGTFVPASNPYLAHSHEVDISSRARINVSGRATSETELDNSRNGRGVWQDLLVQYQEQLQQVRAEAEKANLQKTQMAAQLAHMRKEAEVHEEELAHLQMACRNVEGKLQFRVAQVRYAVWLHAVCVDILATHLVNIKMF